jgi:S1-C subfamily serine protease
VATAGRSTRNFWLAAGGITLAIVSAAQGLRSVDQRMVDVRPVSDLATVSAAANVVPVVRITARTCEGLEAGSGFVLGHGIVVTAAHVVQGATTATVDVDSGPIAADGGRVLTVSAAFEPGMSGGPVVDMNGRVVGVAIGVERNSGTGIAVPTANILGTLRGDALAAVPACAPTN